MTIRIAIVGLGKIARDQHIPAIAATPGIELAAIVSRNSALPDLPAFPNLDALFAADLAVDAVALCTPPQVRRSQAAASLRAGKHVMLEKPPGATVAELAPLVETAAERGLSLFATWHSRSAPGVEPARALLATRRLRSVDIEWREDVRVWHPGQSWIFEPGGLGVFDPGINALSILTRILPQPLFVTGAVLHFPSNKAAPIAAEIQFADAAGIPIRAAFDFLQTGPQTWDIRAETDQGAVLLSSGGAKLVEDGAEIALPPSAEYAGVYRRFVELIESGGSDVDLAPLQLVADAFLLGERLETAPFDG